MPLTDDLISQFVKLTKSDKKTKGETTVYGTLFEQDGKQFVRIDGSELLTPISTTVNAQPGERVVVMIKNHSAVVTGNASSPSARTGDVQGVAKDVSKLYDEFAAFEIVTAGLVTADEMQVERARIDMIVSENVSIVKRLTATEGSIDNLEADYISINSLLEANNADIENLQANKIDVAIADAKYATIDNLNATNARVYNLEVTYGDFTDLAAGRLTAVEAVVDSLSSNYANIDFSNIGQAAMEYFYSKSGLIEDVVVGDSTITGTLVGVTILGDLIKAGTVQADKLVIKGEDGLYYKLNTDGVVTEKDQTDENSLNGSIIRAKTITATKIDVSDLVAFGATIGGFNITDTSLYSGVKTSVDNNTQGIYFDKDGQLAVGDASNYLKYYEDSTGTWHLDVTANSILFEVGDDKKALSDYIRLGFYSDPEIGESMPCIELSDGDSDFRQIITSSKAVFMDGSVERTKIDRYGVSSTYVEAKEQLGVGGFMFKRRDNGNVGLMWKGGLK